MDILTDKKFVISSLLSVALVFTVFLIAGYINLPFYQTQLTEDTTGPGSCLILEQKYCDTARFYTIDANGTRAAVFNVPEETQIYAPFSGTYFDDSIEGDIVVFEQMRFNVPNTDSSMIIVAEHNPLFGESSDVFKGEALAFTTGSQTRGKQDTDFNLVIYTENYDLDNLFSN